MSFLCGNRLWTYFSNSVCDLYWRSYGTYVMKLIFILNSPLNFKKDTSSHFIHIQIFLSQLLFRVWFRVLVFVWVPNTKITYIFYYYSSRTMQFQPVMDHCLKSGCSTVLYFFIPFKSRIQKHGMTYIFLLFVWQAEKELYKEKDDHYMSVHNTEC